MLDCTPLYEQAFILFITLDEPATVVMNECQSFPVVVYSLIFNKVCFNFLKFTCSQGFCRRKFVVAQYYILYNFVFAHQVLLLCRR